VERLKRVGNTEFVDYEKQTGTWVFRVPHFTTYGLDYGDEGESLDQSTLSALPDNPTPKAQGPTQSSMAHHESPVLDSTISIDASSLDGSATGIEDDTFEFKKRKLVPGAFGNQGGIDLEEMGSEEELELFAGDESVGSNSDNDSIEQTESEGLAESEGGLHQDEIEMAGAYPIGDDTMEQATGGGSLKSTFQRLSRPQESPAKVRLDLSGNWTEQLQRTISPRKQDRQALREMQGNLFTGRNGMDNPKAKAVADDREKGFVTSIDLMNSLFRQPGGAGPSRDKKLDRKTKGFEV
jgi:nuclear pore complex protein Nup98-Nup96